MKFLAGYVMRGPAQAILVTAVCALLSLPLPPLVYVSAAVVGMVTLRLGLWRGAMVSGGAALAVSLFSLAWMHTGAPGLAYLVVLWVPMMVLATQLRRTVSLPRTLVLAAVFGGAMVAALHAGMDDPAAFWQKVFEELLKQTGQGPEKLAEMQDAFRLMTGVMAAALTLSLVGCLFVARWWQAQLYNPGGFQSEFHGLRFSRGLGLATLLIAAVGLADTAWAALTGDLLLVLLVLHLLHGLAVVHALVKKTQANPAWLLALYVLLFPLLLPGTVITVAALGFADEWFDFRSFFGNKSEEVR